MTDAAVIEQKLAGMVARKPSQTESLGTFMTLYGQGGAGKTLLAAQLREFGKTAHIDVEGGTDILDFISDETEYDIYEPKRYSEFARIVDSLKRDNQGYVNLIVDNLCEIVDMWITENVGRDAPQIQEWGQMSREILRKVRDLRELARVRGMNVIVIAWDEDTKDGNIIKKDLALTPALRKEYAGINTIVGHIRVLNSPDKRMLDFAPSPRSISKFRRSPTSAAMKVPFQIEYGIENLPLVDVINTIKGKGEWPERKYGKANQK